MLFRKSLDTITLFHKAGSPTSARALAALKSASEKSTANTGVRPAFQLEVTESPPTLDQLSCILKYMDNKKAAPTVVRGAHDAEQAFKKFKETPANFNRPIVVDWNHGKAIATDQESEILKMLEESPDGSRLT